MLYLLDANVLIRAHEDYYPVDRIPQFWDWLAEMGKRSIVKIPYEICGEIVASTGPLHDWLTQTENTRAMLLDQRINPSLLNRGLSEGYASDLDDGEIEEIGNDPFLIGYALVNPQGVTVVTKEVSRPSKQRANRKVPDVCKAFGIRSINDFELYRELDFKIA